MSNNKDQEVVAFVSSGCAILSHRDITIKYSWEILTKIVSHYEPLSGNPFPAVLNIEVLVSLMLSLSPLCKLRCKTRIHGVYNMWTNLEQAWGPFINNTLQAHKTLVNCRKSTELSIQCILSLFWQTINITLQSCNLQPVDKFLKIFPSCVFIKVASKPSQQTEVEHCQE
jgi:hypothetical protein